MNLKKGATGFMAIKKIAKHGTTHPFGDHRSVQQAFPSGIPSKESDPFLMCDYFNMAETKATHEDDFPIGWHPHRGMDIASYVRKGLGRHGDSLGNRETFSGPGMQWMSVGSGVEHAEGGANEDGEVMQGFQIWINVPSQHKMDDPDYGTVSNEDMPVVFDIGGGNSNNGNSGTKRSMARILAGEAFGNTVVGPFRTKQPVQMIDFELQENDVVEFEISSDMDTALLYVYEGALSEANNSSGGSNSKGGLKDGAIVLLDADDVTHRRISMTTAPGQTAGVMLFAGKKLKEPIAWRGPIVMNTQDEIYETQMELKTGNFPRIQVNWDYKKWASRPDGWTMTPSKSASKGCDATSPSEEKKEAMTS